VADFALSAPRGCSELLRGGSGACFPSTQAHQWDPEGLWMQLQTFSWLRQKKTLLGVFFSLIDDKPSLR